MCLSFVASRKIGTLSMVKLRNAHRVQGFHIHDTEAQNFTMLYFREGSFRVTRLPWSQAPRVPWERLTRCLFGEFRERSTDFAKALSTLLLFGQFLKPLRPTKTFKAVFGNGRFCLLTNNIDILFTCMESTTDPVYYKRWGRQGMSQVMARHK